MSRSVKVDYEALRERQARQQEDGGRLVSARAAVNSWGQWIGYCIDCTETASGNRSRVHLWVETHNDAHLAPEQELAADFERNDHR